MLKSQACAAQALASAAPDQHSQGCRILVIGGASAVGRIVVQLAKVLYSAYVVSTVGPSDIAAFQQVGMPLRWFSRIMQVAHASRFRWLQL